MDIENGHILPRMQKWQTESGLALINYADIIATADGLKNIKWLDSLPQSKLVSIFRRATYIKIIIVPQKLSKTKQLKHLISKINLPQQYHADKLFEIIQSPTDEMIADSLTKPKSANKYATAETASRSI